MFKGVTTLSVCVAVCLVASVCHGQDDWQKAIHGMWKCDAEKTMAAMKEAGAAEAEMDMMKELASGMSLELKEGTLVMMMDAGGFKQEMKATYKVEESNEEKNWIKIEVKMEDQPDDAKIGEITLLGKDSMKLEPDDGSVLIFARVKDEEKKADDDG